jgi:hypothetical protein
MIFQLLFILYGILLCRAPGFHGTLFRRMPLKNTFLMLDSAEIIFIAVCNHFFHRHPSKLLSSWLDSELHVFGLCPFSGILKTNEQGLFASPGEG